MGAIGVMLSSELDVDEATDAIERIGASIVHLVYPLWFGESSPFERFGNRLSESVRKRLKEPLVHACFHPAMVGGRENAYRLIGLLRQAPDPFVQFIPAGLQQGGTVLAGEEPPSGSHAEARFQRLVEAVPPGQPTASDVLAKLEALREAKAQTYAALAREIAGAR